MVGLRLSQAEIARVDRWAAKRDVTRSEAIRALIKRALQRKMVR